jgi:ribonuclease-3
VATSPSAIFPRPVDTLVGYLEQVVGERVDEPLLVRALTHRSFAYEHGGLPNNERTHPDLPEGQLAKLRAAVVNMRALAEVARTVGLGDYIFLGRGEEATGGRDKASILADTMEAIIGTIHLSCGMVAASAFVHHLFDPLMTQSATLGAGLDWKTSLQELAAQEALGTPEYHVEESGPDHEKEFVASAVVAEEVLGHGTGRSKKEAEQRAAEQAWATLDTRRQPSPPLEPGLS